MPFALIPKLCGEVSLSEIIETGIFSIPFNNILPKEVRDILHTYTHTYTHKHT